MAETKLSLHLLEVLNFREVVIRQLKSLSIEHLSSRTGALIDCISSAVTYRDILYPISRYYTELHKAGITIIEIENIDRILMKDFILNTILPENAIVPNFENCNHLTFIEYVEKFYLKDLVSTYIAAMDFQPALVNCLINNAEKFPVIKRAAETLGIDLENVDVNDTNLDLEGWVALAISCYGTLRDNSVLQIGDFDFFSLDPEWVNVANHVKKEFKKELSTKFDEEGLFNWDFIDDLTCSAGHIRDTALNELNNTIVRVNLLQDHPDEESMLRTLRLFYAYVPEDSYIRLPYLGHHLLREEQVDCLRLIAKRLLKNSSL